MPQVTAVSESVDARALNLLKQYMAKVGDDISQDENIAARDAFIYAFRLGYVRGKEDMRQACTDLAAVLGQFRMALTEVEHLIEIGTA